MGNRIAKIQKPKNWTDEEEWTITWYARDAQGNVLAIYNKPQDSLSFRATEFNIYGSSRLGMVTQPEALPETPQVPLAHSQTLGLKVYEFSNHLGNVLTTFSDRKIATEGTPGYVAHYTAEILSSTDYYPFGFEMPGRSYTGGVYRYGFQGQEDDPEVHGSKSTSIYFKYRIHDTRIGRFLSVDPLAGSYPYNSSYAFSENDVIRAIELEGLQKLVVVHGVKSDGSLTKTVHSKEIPKWMQNAATLGVTLRYPLIAAQVGHHVPGSINISSICARISRHVAADGNMTTGEATERNAYRHALWSAVLSHEFGNHVANRIMNAHEGIRITESYYIDHEAALPQDIHAIDQIVDLLNNEIGQDIASRLGEDATTLDIAKEVLKVQRDEGLWISHQGKDGEYSIKQAKISQRQYERALKKLDSLDNNFKDEKDRESDKKKVDEINKRWRFK